MLHDFSDALAYLRIATGFNYLSLLLWIRHIIKDSPDRKLAQTSWVILKF